MPQFIFTKYFFRHALVALLKTTNHRTRDVLNCLRILRALSHFFPHYFPAGNYLHAVFYLKKFRINLNLPLARVLHTDANLLSDKTSKGVVIKQANASRLLPCRILNKLTEKIAVRFLNGNRRQYDSTLTN